MSDTGTLILLVGASGVGKDTLLSAAAAELAESPDFVFPNRLITRAEGYGGEVHHEVSDEEFGALVARNGFALHWEAHGFRYGIPFDVCARLDAGLNVVVNSSRTVIDEARERFTRVRVVHITVPEDVLDERLHSRGREDTDSVRARLARSDVPAPEGPDVVEFVNALELPEATKVFVALLKDLV